MKHKLIITQTFNFHDMIKHLFKVFTFMITTFVVTLSSFANDLNHGGAVLATTTDEDIITISSSEDFSDFYGKLCGGTTFAGQTVVLNDDISFETGGKSGVRNFEGKLDGRGHKLKDVTSSIFTNNRGEICNLHVSSGSLNGSGIFCTSNYGSIVNCKNSANIHYTSSSSEGIRSGGICDSNYGNIMNCVNEGNVRLELTAIYGSWSKGTTLCGGICAYSGSGASIINCTNTGEINNSGIYFSITGGIVASTEHTLIAGCKNYGLVYSYILNSSPSKGNVTVESYQHQHVGGIAGHVLYCVINRCINYGTVKSNFQYLGGIAGYVGNSDVYNLENFGNLEGYEGYGFHSVSGIIPYFKNPYKRQYFLNCINHGNISVFAKYGVATGAGISAEIENAYIANCYSNCSISCSNTGNMSAKFQIPQYEFENSEELNVGISNASDANAFISSYDSPETLLRWIDNSGVLTLCGDYFSHPIAQHGNCKIYVYPEDSEKIFSIKVWVNKSNSQPVISATSKSPLEVRGLMPDTDYNFEVYSEDGGINVDSGNFRTLSPTISFNTSSVGYDNIIFKHFCDVKGVDNLNAYLHFNDEDQSQRIIEVSDSIVNVNGLDEEINYSAQMVYQINGKEYKSEKINTTTKAIIPQFSLVSQTPYSLTLRCDNFEELKKYNPEVYIKEPKLYDFGGFNVGESRYYELDNDGIVTIDSLLYGYTPNLFGKYTINGENRLRDGGKFSTLKWGGEGIIQLSPNAAMVHGLFGGIGEMIPEVGSIRYKYDRARFYYRDATAADDNSESYRDGVCIDNGVDYAVTIPINSYLYQYYISLQYSSYTNPKNHSKNGEWQIIDARFHTVDVVEPRFYNVRYENNTLKSSCIQGEEKIIQKFFKYKVEDANNFNTIILSTKDGTEALSRTLTSIVPQLTYIVRFGCKTEGGKIYYSPYYKLYDGKIELFEDYKEPIKISDITLNETTIVLNEGQAMQLTATVSPENAENKSLTWTSSNESVVTVTQDGLVTAEAQGHAVITVKTSDGSDLTAICNVEVCHNPILVTNIILNPTIIEGEKEETWEIMASVLPENADNKDLLWYSSDNAVASVSPDGLVSLLSKGTAIITAIAADESDVKAECIVIVEDKVGIEDILIDNNSHVKIYTLTGVLVFDGEYSQSNLSSGTYIVLINNKAVKIVIK